MLTLRHLDFNAIAVHSRPRLRANAFEASVGRNGIKSSRRSLPKKQKEQEISHRLKHGNFGKSQSSEYDINYHWNDINTLHYTDGSRHNATKGYFIGHLNAACSLDKLEDLQRDFMSRMLTIVSVKCFTETCLVQGACIESFLMKQDPCQNPICIVKWEKSAQI